MGDHQRTPAVVCFLFLLFYLRIHLFCVSIVVMKQLAGCDEVGNPVRCWRIKLIGASKVASANFSATIACRREPQTNQAAYALYDKKKSRSCLLLVLQNSSFIQVGEIASRTTFTRCRYNKVLGGCCYRFDLGVPTYGYHPSGMYRLKLY